MMNAFTFSLKQLSPDRIRRHILLGTLLLTPGFAMNVFAQTSSPNPTQTQTAPVTTPAPAPAPGSPSTSSQAIPAPTQTANGQRGQNARRTARQTGTATRQTIPLESAPPTAPPAPISPGQQQRADERLLHQQEAQSDKAAAVNDQQVQRAQQRQDTLQNQQRIQDAPGPPQPVPAAGPQTIPPLQSVDPSQLPQPGQTAAPQSNPGQQQNQPVPPQAI